MAIVAQNSSTQDRAVGKALQQIPQMDGKFTDGFGPDSKSSLHLLIVGILLGCLAQTLLASALMHSASEGDSQIFSGPMPAKSSRAFSGKVEMSILSCVRITHSDEGEASKIANTNTAIATRIVRSLIVPMPTTTRILASEKMQSANFRCKLQH